MSEQTAKALEQATAEVERVRAVADACKAACVEKVAQGVRPALERIAKRTAHAQPEVTKALGASGVKAFREDLAASAEAFAADLRSSADGIEWPRSQSQFSPVSARDVHSAFFRLLYGRPVNQLGEVFKNHGYDVDQGHSDGQQHLILPQSLYDESDFAEAAQALHALEIARGAEATAKAEDDRDAVDALWEEE